MSPLEYDIEAFLKSLDWGYLPNLFGSAHNSTIGFLTHSWLKYEPHGFVLDGAPSSHVGNRDVKKKYADLLLCKNSSPTIVVEVESSVTRYSDKLSTLDDYLSNNAEFSGLQWGLLVLLNYTGRKKDGYKHEHWDDLRTAIVAENRSVALLSIAKMQGAPPFDRTVHPRLLEDRGYFQWRNTSVKYWVHPKDCDAREKTIWGAG